MKPQLVPFSFWQWRNQGSERLGNLSKATQPCRLSRLQTKHASPSDFWCSQCWGEARVLASEGMCWSRITEEHHTRLWEGFAAILRNLGVWLKLTSVNHWLFLWLLGRREWNCLVIAVVAVMVDILNKCVSSSFNSLFLIRLDWALSFISSIRERTWLLPSSLYVVPSPCDFIYLRPGSPYILIMQLFERFQYCLLLRGLWNTHHSPLIRGD